MNSVFIVIIRVRMMLPIISVNLGQNSEISGKSKGKDSHLMTSNVASIVDGSGTFSPTEQFRHAHERCNSLQCQPLNRSNVITMTLTLWIAGAY